jgi:hypothetical protein
MSEATPSRSTGKIIGWILSGLLTAFLLFSSMGKFSSCEGKAEMFAKLGWSEDVMFYIGVVEVIIAVMFVIPRTAFIGAILITAYLGGAIATHVRISDPFIFPIIIGVIYWVALGLRDQRIFTLAFGMPTSK